MFTYIKSLIAVGLALLLALGAGAWAHSRSSVLKALKREVQNQKKQIAGAEQDSAIMSNLEKRMETIRRDIEEKSVRLSARDEEGLRLIQAVVKAASGMEMTGVSEMAATSRVSNKDDASVSVNAVSYRISLQGTYAGLVKFFQNVASWELENKIEALEISRPDDEEMKLGYEVNADFTLSIFSID